jgi:hypothetical protein
MARIIQRLLLTGLRKVLQAVIYTITLAGTVGLLLVIFIGTETAITVIRPHRSEEAERYEESRRELDRDRAVLETYAQR